MGSIRDRKSIVCSFCKKRKIKCNKAAPCSSCVKYKNPNCEYNYTAVATSPTPGVINRRPSGLPVSELNDGVEDSFLESLNQNISSPFHSHISTVESPNKLDTGFNFPPIQTATNPEPSNSASGPNSAGPSEYMVGDVNYDTNYFSIIPPPASSSGSSTINQPSSGSNNKVDFADYQQQKQQQLFRPYDSDSSDNSSVQSPVKASELLPHEVRQRQAPEFSIKGPGIESDKFGAPEPAYAGAESTSMTSSVMGDFSPNHRAVFDESLKLASYNTIGNLATLGLNVLQQYEFVEKNTSSFDDSKQKLSFVGPLSWIGAMKTDNFVRYLYMHGNKSMETQYQRFQLNSDSNYKLNKRYLMKFKYENIKKESNLWVSTSPDQFLVSRSPMKNDMNLPKVIKKLLISPSEAETVLDTFFSEIYPFMPILDQASFTEAIKPILCFNRDINLDEVVINSVDNYLHVSILLLITKIVEVVTILKGDDTDSQDFDLDLECSFESESIEVAKVCVQKFLASDVVNVPLLQVIILLRAYSRYALHLGDCVDKGMGEIYNVMIFEVSKRLGLNRDPEMNPYLAGKDKHLLRKIWHYLRIMENCHFVSMSSPIFSSSNHSVAIPFATYDTKNVKDPIVEHVGDELYPSAHLFENIYRQMSMMILSSDKSFKLSKMSELVNEYRGLLHEDIDNHLPKHLKSQKQTSAIEHDFWISIITARFFNIHGVFLATLMNFSNYCCQHRDYESVSRLNIIITKLIYYKVLPVVSKLLNHNNFKAVDGSFIIMPLISSVLNLIMIFNISFIIKIKLLIIQYPEQDKHIDNLYFKNLLMLQELMYKSCKLVMTNYLQRLSRYYFFSWTVKHTYRYYLEELEDEETFRSIFDRHIQHKPEVSSTTAMFERYGFKDNSCINDLKNNIYGPISELVYESEFGSGHSPNLMTQMRGRLSEACEPDPIFAELTGETNSGSRDPQQKMDANQFNEIMNPNQLVTPFFA